jgi:hypothetical protein
VAAPALRSIQGVIKNEIKINIIKHPNRIIIMPERYVYGSLTRISNLETRPFSVQPLEKNDWETGDYVVGKFIPSNNPIHEEVETTTGRLLRLLPGDMLVGALGVRKATKENVGDWHLIGKDGKMQDICGSGMFGAETDFSKTWGPSANFVYQGHVLRGGTKVCMKDFVPNTTKPTEYSSPTILIIGTSMSCGKTTAARVIIHQLKSIGIRKVVGTKLTGAGFLHDNLSMKDAGADVVYDFVDAGLPSTILPEHQYQQCLQKLLSFISLERPDVVVAEAGASPCEAYNGDVVLKSKLLKEGKATRPNLTILCASDPYAAVGAIKLLEQNAGIHPDLVTGLVTSTSAGLELVRGMCDVPALSFTSEEGINTLTRLLAELFGDHRRSC